MQPLDAPFMTVSDMIRGYSKWFGDKEAWVYRDRRVTWREFNAGVNRVANALIGLGLEKGDKVALLMLDGIETAEVIFGTVKAGCVTVPLSPMTSPPALERMIQDCAAKAFFVGAPLEAILQKFSGPPQSVLPGGLVALGFELTGWRPFPDAVGGASEEEPNVPVRPEDEFIIVYTSGTTGVPKGIVHTHYGRDRFGLTAALAFGVDHHARTLLTTPLFTNGTWAMMLPTVLAGGTTFMAPKFDPGQFLATVESERVTHSIMTPPQFAAILNHPEADTRDMNSLRLLASVGSNMRSELRQRVLDRFGCNFIETYGLTEGVSTIIDREQMERKAGTVGKPGMGNDLRIIDDAGNELPAGEKGEIVGYANILMKGYHNRPDLTEEAIWLDERGRTYLKTGDIGVLDEDGFLTILDRKKDMIVSGGLNVFAIDIEEVFGQHPDVLDVAVIGVPHEKWGETPLALVIRKPGAPAMEEELKEWANQRLGKHQRVFAVRFMDEFPRNALGKVLKRQIREAIQQAPSA